MQRVATRRREFARGSVGAGRGMSCFGLKGGIGSASRASTADARCTRWARWCSRTSAAATLTLARRRDRSPRCWHAAARQPTARARARSSCIIATDAPLDRAPVAPPRAARRRRHRAHRLVLRARQRRHRARVLDGLDGPAARRRMRRAVLARRVLDPLFQAAADGAEQAIVDALFSAEYGEDGPVTDASSQRSSIKDITHVHENTDFRRTSKAWPASFHPEQTRAGNPRVRARAPLDDGGGERRDRGAFDGGATEVWVNDSHGGFRNLLPGAARSTRADGAGQAARRSSMMAGVERRAWTACA